jgi:hypothetical protein
LFAVAREEAPSAIELDGDLRVPPLPHRGSPFLVRCGQTHTASSCDLVNRKLIVLKFWIYSDERTREHEALQCIFVNLLAIITSIVGPFGLSACVPPQ